MVVFNCGEERFSARSIVSEGQERGASFSIMVDVSDPGRNAIYREKMPDTQTPTLQNQSIIRTPGNCIEILLSR